MSIYYMVQIWSSFREMETVILSSLPLCNKYITPKVATSTLVFRASAALSAENKKAHSSCFQPLTIITKRSILDVAAALDPPLHV